MANSTIGTVKGRNFLVPHNVSQIPTEALQDSRYQNLASNNFTTVPAFPLGSKVETFDGRVFRYIENGTSTAFAEGSVLTNIAIATMTAASTSADGLTITGTAPGATQYLDEHVGSYAYISVGTGEGVARRIVANSASVASTAGMTIQLERSIGASLSSLTIILVSPWRMRLAPTGIVGRAKGVSFGIVAAQTGSGVYVAGGVSYYGWMQTRGTCEKVLVTAASPAASAVSGALTVSATVAGSADPIANGGVTNDDVCIFGYTMPNAASYDVGVMADLFCE